MNLDERDEIITAMRPLMPEPTKARVNTWVVPLCVVPEAAFNREAEDLVQVAELEVKLCESKTGAKFWAWCDIETERIYL